MITQSYSFTTREVNKEQIWKLLSDVDNWKNWDTSIHDAKLVGEFKTGSSFILHPKGSGKIKIKLVDVRPTSYFKDLTVFPLAKMYGEHWYEETPDGLKITIKMTIQGLLASLWNRIVMKDIVKHLPDDVVMQIEASRKL